MAVDGSIPSWPTMHDLLIKDAENFVVVNKPSGMLTHKTNANEPGTLVDHILKQFPDIENIGDSSERPGIVQRLDREASGVLVIARTDEMFNCLKDQFKDRTVDKEYVVLVHGLVESEHGEIDFLVERGAKGRMAARPHIDKNKVKNVGKEQTGKVALTEFWVEKRFARFTLLRVKIHTGRTHQIRVHMQAYGHPVVGDNLYFNKKLNRKRDLRLGRLFLHAKKLCISNLDNERLCFEAELPHELNEFLSELR